MLLSVAYCEAIRYASRRRVVQIDVTTTDVHLEMSQYIKRELHSLVDYLHSSFVDEELTSTINRHFAKRVGLCTLAAVVSCLPLCYTDALSCHIFGGHQGVGGVIETHGMITTRACSLPGQIVCRLI